MRKESAKFLTKIEDVPKIAAEIGKIKSVKAVYLFGSHATGKSNELSDIDICIVGDLNEKERLDVLKHSYDNLDISFFEDLPLVIQFRILRDGKPLFAREDAFLRELKLRTIREYLDYSSFYRQFCRRAIENV